MDNICPITSTQFVETRIDLLKFLPNNIRIAELGVHQGNFSKEILDIVRPKELYLVDYFKGCVMSGDKDGYNETTVNLEEQYKALKILYRNKGNVKIVKSSTKEFLESLPNFYLDAIYIDANHSYHAVSEDLDLSIQKVKQKGYILGHDYTELYGSGGTIVAVNEFVQKNNLILNYLSKDRCPSYFIKLV
jgi:hypothetical protein